MTNRIQCVVLYCAQVVVHSFLYALPALCCFDKKGVEGLEVEIVCVVVRKLVGFCWMLGKTGEEVRDMVCCLN